MDTIDADMRATKTAADLVSGRPPARIVQFPGATQQMIDGLRQRYMADIAGKQELYFVGGDQPITSESLVFSLADNQFMEWQLYLARKICAVFGISPQQIGLTFDINKATAQSQQDIFEDTGLIPLLLLLEEFLNREFLADFAPIDKEGRPDMNALNLRIIYPEVSEVMRKAHLQETVATVRVALGAATGTTPFATLNMALEMMGEKPVQGGNTFYFPTSVGPVPMASYDGDYGPFGTSGFLGAQDPQGGIDEDEDDDTSASGKTTPDATPRAGDETNGTGEQPTIPDGGNEVTVPSPQATDGKSFSEWSLKLKAADSGEHTSIWLGLYLDRKTAKWLAIPGGEAPEDLHITLAMLGDVSERSPADLKRLRRTLATFAASQAPLDGRISGFGRFTDVPAGQPTVLYASPDLPGLPAYRAALVEQLTAIGFAPDTTYGYTPHITLAYIPADEALPIDDVPALSLHFEQVWLAVADTRSSYDMDGEPATKALTLPHYQPVALPLWAQRGVDLRLPGKPWTPHLDQRSLLTRSAQPRGKVPQHIADSYRRPPGEIAARSQASQHIQHIFDEVAARGRAQA